VYMLIERQGLGSEVASARASKRTLLETHQHRLGLNQIGLLHCDRTLYYIIIGDGFKKPDGMR